MLEQLKELLEMQSVLDEAILKEHGNVYDEVIAEKMKIALFVELGELMNELPTYFKHWKKSAKDNRENALVEYVDALHFTLSLFNHYGAEVYYVHEYDRNNFLQKFSSLSEALRLCVELCETTDGLIWLFNIGNYLGFTWQEIYYAYKSKNQVNYERLKSGY